MNKGGNLIVNSHLETSNDVMNVDNDDIPCTSSLPSYNPSTGFNSRIQTELHSNHVNNIARSEITRSSQNQDPRVSVHNGGGSDISSCSNLDPSSSLTFKEKYSYPENS